MPTLINIHGPIASGKSTTCDALLKKLKDYAFVNRAYIKTMLSPIGKSEAKQISGKATIFIIKELTNLNKNILVQEHNPEKLKKRLGNSLKNYSLHSFYLDVSLKEALKRDKAREKKTTSKHKIEQRNKTLSPSKLDTVIDTENNSVDRIVKIILKQIKS